MRFMRSRSLARAHPNARFTIAGEGPLQAAMEKLRDELGLRDKVTFAGFLKGPELCELYQRSHVFLHPSRMTEDQNQEGVPNSMLEAMATGLPVIATQHGGIPEAVRDGVSGILVAERDRDGAASKRCSSSLPTRLSGRAPGLSAANDVRENFESLAQIERLEAAYDEARRLSS